MTQKLVQTQQQKQGLTLTPQQILQVRLVEMPVVALEERVRAELDENAALEVSPDEYSDNAEDGTMTADRSNDNDEPATYLTADGMSDYARNKREDTSRQREVAQPASETLYDHLLEQIKEGNFTEQQTALLTYLAGSLDDNGYLCKDITVLVDELAIYHNIETSPEVLQELLTVLQSFDPPGVGAHSLQECLLLQVDAPENVSPYKKEQREVLEVYFEKFKEQQWSAIQRQLKLEDEQWSAILKELTRLNPRPGASFNYTGNERNLTIIPDFFVERDDNDTLVVRLNNDEIPTLHISRAFIEIVEQGNKDPQLLSTEQQEAYQYAKQRVEAGRGFIRAIQQRQQTLLRTMKAIVKWQGEFFQCGDVASLVPMRLRDIAGVTELDTSTVSRVSNSKYVQTDFGIFALKFFFREGLLGSNGEELSSAKVKDLIQEYIDGEDKRKPLSDEAITKLLKETGLIIARRTVAKYREQLGISTSQQRNSANR